MLLVIEGKIGLDLFFIWIWKSYKEVKEKLMKGITVEGADLAFEIQSKLKSDFTLAVKSSKSDKSINAFSSTAF